MRVYAEFNYGKAYVYLIPHNKIDSRWIKDLNSMKLLKCYKKT